MTTTDTTRDPGTDAFLSLADEVRAWVTRAQDSDMPPALLLQLATEGLRATVNRLERALLDRTVNRDAQEGS